MKLKNNTKGFTLIELLVVIAIIGLLSSIVLASLSSARARARDAKRIGDLRSLEKALTLYSLSNNAGIPAGFYSSWSEVPTKPDGTLDCATINSLQDSVYETLVAAKALSEKPDPDPYVAKGYCYVYITNTTTVAGASYDHNGNALNLEGGEPIAYIIATKRSSAVFAGFLENTKTTSGYPAAVGITYGNSPSAALNLNLTTGEKNDINYSNGSY